jgi:hypothetical protein
MSVESLDTAVAFAVAEGRRAAVDLRRLVNDANRELENATSRLGPFHRTAAGLDGATGDQNAVTATCVGCGRTAHIPLSR